MTPLSAILLFSLCALVAALIGVAALALWPSGVKRFSGVLEAAAGGALLVMGLIFLSPEAAQHSPLAWPLIAAGVALGAGLQFGASWAAGPRAGALTLAAGLGLHSLLDGAVFTVSLSADPAFGLGSALGLVMHDAPKALFSFVLLRRAGLGTASSAGGALALAAGLSAFGAFASAPVMDGMSMQTLGALLGVAAGLLIYSGAACLASTIRAPALDKAAAAVAAAVLVAAIGQAGRAAHEAGETRAPVIADSAGGLA